MILERSDIIGSDDENILVGSSQYCIRDGRPAKVKLITMGSERKCLDTLEFYKKKAKNESAELSHQPDNCSNVFIILIL